MERAELPLVIGMFLAGQPACPMPLHEPMRQEDAVRWTMIRDANRADRALRLISRPQLGVKFY